jgi:hypothetical protein
MSPVNGRNDTSSLPSARRRAKHGGGWGAGRHRAAKVKGDAPPPRQARTEHGPYHRGGLVPVGHPLRVPLPVVVAWDWPDSGSQKGANQ